MSSVLEIVGLLTAMQGGETASNSAAVESVWDFVTKGGWMMVPIGLCSFVVLTVLLERTIVLRRRSIIPAAFLPGLKKILSNGGRDKVQAIKYCIKHKSPVARVFTAGIKKLGSSVELIEKHIDEAGQREVLKLRKNLRVLSVIAAVAPLLGLLGTIFGMIRAFQTVATSGEALGKTEMLATGIYEAMITTAAGLIVAIPALIFYHWLSAKVERLVMEIDHMTVDFIEEYIDPESAAIAEIESKVTAPETVPEETQPDITVAPAT